ncbi:DUF2867 domain-containing protein [Streptomyces sp. NPDC018031]|uniref:DUF2867 domain-containing protein n=1 Tax=Streptomyces sp. NPDC018031 TaxID=3365033 RepID=UPI00379B5187
MRLPDTAHTATPWRIHEFTSDFTLEDVWALPTPGGPDDLPRLVRQFTSDDDAELSELVISTLFAIRWKLGALLGLDKPGNGLGERVTSLRERLPDDLRDGPRGPDLQVVPFHSVYQTDTEWTAELANRTVHALMHIGWVPDGAGRYRGQMAALVKPNGALGEAYMAGIKPIRRTLVYPSLIRSIGRNWPRYT